MQDFFKNYLPERNLKLSSSDRLTVFPEATQVISDAFVNELVDIVHASPSPPGTVNTKMDTVLIRREAGAHGLRTQSYGMSGKCIGPIHPHNAYTNYFQSIDHRVGRVRLIFKLPPHYEVPDPLVYIQTFQGPHSQTPLKLVNMYQVKRSRYTAQYHHHYEEEIIPLSMIRRTCHLLPVFGTETPVADPSKFDALEMFEQFYVNSYLDLHTFQFLF